MIRVGIAEDERDYRGLLRQYLTDYESSADCHFKISEYADGKDLVDHYSGNLDIIFLDIEMPQLDGMEAARQIRAKDSEVVLVFITNVASYVLKGYEVDAFDYILKPLQYQSFAAKMDKLLRGIRKEKHYLMLTFRADVKRLATDQILYVEARGHSVTYYTKDDQFTVRDSLKNVEKQLANDHFSRCGHSFLVNLDQVQSAEGDTVIVAGRRVPLSRTRKSGFLQDLSDYIAEQ